MAHRDDVEALRARLEAQERELRDARAELDVLRAAVHRDVARDFDRGPVGEAAAPFENRTDAPAMGFSPGPRPLAPLRGETQRRLGMLILMITTLVAGLFLATTPCPSSRYRRATIRPPAVSAAHDEPAFAPFVRFAEVTDPGTPAALEGGEACAVEVTPVTDSTFDCRVVVRCGDRILYGRDERRGGTGYNHCGPIPSLIVDSNVTEDDGDPAFRMDLATGEVIIEERLGLGRQRVELRLLAPE